VPSDFMTDSCSICSPMIHNMITCANLIQSDRYCWVIQESTDPC